MSCLLYSNSLVVEFLFFWDVVPSDHGQEPYFHRYVCSYYKHLNYSNCICVDVINGIHVKWKTWTTFH